MKHLRTALAGAMALLCASAHAQTSQSGLTTDALANWIASNGVAAYQAEQDAQAAKTAAAAALQPGNNLSDVVSAAIARTNLGLGAMALQAASNVAITGGAINGTPIGGTTPAAGSFTTLSASSLSGLTMPLSVGQGGTGAQTSSAARSSLGAAVSGANGDITSLSGLTTPLSQPQGGTGTTAATGTGPVVYAASPALTGVPTAPTAAIGTASSQIATTDFVLKNSGLATAAVYFGDGSDGNATISSGTVTLTRDMYYANLTLSGTGQINTAGFKVFVSGTLDLTQAGVGAITDVLTPASSGDNGSASSGSGGAGATLAAGTAQAATTSPAGAAAPLSGSAPGINSGAGLYVGGLGGAGGAGGAGASSGGLAGAVTSGNAVGVHSVTTQFVYGVTIPQPGIPGAGGGSGGVPANHAASGGGGGAGGLGGGNLGIFANVIARGPSTAGGAISANGAAGGNGGTGLNGSGGGGAGGGGGGGFVLILYGSLSGSSVTGLATASGGEGGSGGTGTAGTGSNGAGGAGAYGGSVLTANVTTGVLSTAKSGAPGVVSGQTGGAGGICSANL